MTGAMALAQFPLVEQRHGYQPLRLSRDVSIFTHGAFPVPKKAPWVNEFNSNLLRLVEGGIVSHITRSYILPRYLVPEKLVAPPPKAFQFEHILLAVIILAAGTFVSGVVFVFEKMLSVQIRQ